MGAEGATFGPVIRVGGRGKKSPGGRAVCVSWQGRGKVLGDAWARQCGRQQSQALCKVVVRVTGHAHQVEGDGLQSGIADASRPESWQVHLS